MNPRNSWRLVALLLLSVVAVPGPALGQTITGITAQPNPSCAGATVTIRLTGTGNCSNVRVNFDPGESTALMSGALPLVYTAVFDDPGGLVLTVQTNDPGCTVTAPPRVHTVNDCPEFGELVAGLAPAGRVFTSIVPKVSAYYGVVQPGNEAPFLIFGERLPLKGEEATGEAFLATGGGLVKLTVDEWSTSGTWGALRVPDWLSGVSDQKALLWARSAAGWESKQIAVDFIAEREVKLLPREDIDLVGCGTDANRDCCTGFAEVGGSFNPWDGETIQEGCPQVAGATFEGFHENDWGAVGDDRGTDTYRIALANGWVIERIEFTSKPSDAGEASAAKTTLSSPAGHATWDESIKWWVTPNDDVLYHGRVFITGPKGTSHK